ncbi:hypothetical protein DM02DRAFT_547678 [Periconia macrospinosa]|uniref:Zn(2)-C6 fungal-type domain-containing protein n=1 Tax=Periconia macrospinosa TaxID=97972 RepID=A0A2V1CYX9_9PLEO|nr:hypothetical protein DM02DRAFT_547678 [Periconia macrospinosa]
MDDRSNQTKVAIPRLERPENNHKPTHNQAATKRVPKACSNCRSHKVRCSGEQPRCQNCARQSVPCTYLQARRDRLKEFVSHLWFYTAN